MMIDLITYSDNYQKILKTLFFKPTFDLYLSKDFRHIDIVEDNNLENLHDFGFGSTMFQHMIYKRWELLIKHILDNKCSTQWSVFSDIDILFFGNFKRDISAFLNHGYYQFNAQDVLFMPETPSLQNLNPHHNFNINAGFFIFRHSQGSLDFFQYILDFMRSQKIKEDQLYIRQHLKENFHPNIGLLNFEHFNTNNCDLYLNTNLLHKRKLKVFHATSCFNINDKIKLMYQMISSMRDQVLNKIYNL